MSRSEFVNRRDPCRESCVRRCATRSPWPGALSGSLLALPPDQSRDQKGGRNQRPSGFAPALVSVAKLSSVSSGYVYPASVTTGNKTGRHNRDHQQHRFMAVSLRGPPRQGLALIHCIGRAKAQDGLKPSDGR